MKPNLEDAGKKSEFCWAERSGKAKEVNLSCNLGVYFSKPHTSAIWGKPAGSSYFPRNRFWLFKEVLDIQACSLGFYAWHSTAGSSIYQTSPTAGYCLCFAHCGGWWRAMVPLQHCDLLCPAKKVHPSGDLPWDLTMWFYPGSPHHGEKIFKRIHLFPRQLQPYNWVVKWGTVCWHSRIPLAHGYSTRFSRRDWVYQCKWNCWN